MNNDTRIGELLRGLLHELNNRLSPASILLPALEEDLEGDNAIDARDCIKSIAAAHELTRVLRDLSALLLEPTSGDLRHECLLEFTKKMVHKFPHSNEFVDLGRGPDIDSSDNNKEKSPYARLRCSQ